MKKGLSGQNLGRVSKWFNKNAEKLDYKDAIYMSRLTGIIMWITSDYIPYQLACRDKYELRDNIIRGGTIGLVFWGGDLFLKKLFGKISDKCFGTNLINKETKQAYKFSELKNPQNVESLKNISPKILEKTRKSAVGFYALNLAVVMGFLGFGLPYLLNILLHKSVDKDKADTNKSSLQFNIIPEVFKQLKNVK